MDKNYLHQLHEETISSLWKRHDVYNPDAVRAFRHAHNLPITNTPFSIIMPPPNANDPLHIGHAMFVALEDVMIRFHRMLGDDTVWMPGTDHAGIETQFVFEKKLKKKNQSRFQFDRETLYRMIWDYVQENSDVAKNQLVKMGASADWSRFTFMLDEKVVQIVRKTFFDLHAAGLIYRDHRLVNYCSKCGTAFSELEVKHTEQVDPMYYIKYGPFTIATVRPETKFCDVALAVHPEDPRYTQYLGKTLQIPGLLGPLTMTVVGDEGVDPAFGTGIMKVSPAHDAHDFELGKQHNLPVTPIITLDGRMDFSWFFEQAHTQTVEQRYLDRAHRYHRLKVAEARKVIVQDLEEDGLLVKIDANYTHTVGRCYRCETIIEPLPLPQLFLKVGDLTRRALALLETNQPRVIGAGHDKILRHWLENLKDWNISRQIVWGIRIPVWYNIRTTPTMEAHLTVDGERISGTIESLLERFSLEQIREHLQELRPPMDAEYVISELPPNQDDYLQDTDTFDTWFSSAQWPYATLQAHQPGDFARFYPTQVMETGYDILPFWVMRMILLGLFTTNTLPFSTVYLHGLVRDQQGKKMSKSKGNVINPLEIIEKFGADALRMALVIRSSPGLDKSVGEPDFKAMRNFTNKIWNAARFILTQSENKIDQSIQNENIDDAAFLQKMQSVAVATTQHLSEYRLGLAADTLHQEFWHWFCDECIEKQKRGELSLDALRQGLFTFLHLLHPFMPFVTEAIWQEFLQSHTSLSPVLSLSAWPTSMKE